MNPVFISDIYMQNTPELTKVNAILSFTNETSSSVKQDVELIVNEKGNPDKVVFRQTLKAISFPAGNHEVTILSMFPMPNYGISLLRNCILAMC